MQDQKQQNHNQQKKIALINDLRDFGRMCSDRSAASGYFHDESTVLCCSDSNLLGSYSL